MGWLYMIICLVNHKIYIGQTLNDDVTVRWKDECRNPHGRLKNAFAKHGLDNFVFVKLFEMSLLTHGEHWKKMLNTLEFNTIASCRALSPLGYNLQPGGDNHECHPETRAKISVAHVGKTHSAETREKMSVAQSGENHPNFGKSYTAETKEKMSVAKSGENNPIFGKTRSTETRAKIIASISKSIEQWSKDGVFIKSWASGKEAGIALNIHCGNISTVLNGKLKTSGGFVWKHPPPPCSQPSKICEHCI